MQSQHTADIVKMEAKQAQQEAKHAADIVQMQSQHTADIVKMEANLTESRAETAKLAADMVQMEAKQTAETSKAESRFTILSNKIFMLCKLQASIVSIEIMKCFLNLSQDYTDRGPPQHAANANKSGLELSNMLNSVFKNWQHVENATEQGPEFNVTRTIEVIDQLWYDRNNVAHNNNQPNETIDVLIATLKENEKDLTEKELLSLRILEKRNLIAQAPKCKPRSGAKAAKHSANQEASEPAASDAKKGPGRRQSRGKKEVAGVINVYAGTGNND
jgi:hypothetical protein